MPEDKHDIRVDAAGKLTAETRFIRDIRIPGMWYGTTIRSPHPHARIKQIIFDPVFEWQSVVRVTAADIPNNYVAMLEKDMPFLADKVVRYVGEPVVLLAAADRDLLREAARRVLIEYEPLPAVFDMLASENSPVRIFGDNNIFKEILITKGNLDEAQKSSDVVVEIETETGFQEHLYLEPQGIIAIPKKGGIEIHGSLQCPYYVKNALDNMFDGKQHITVIQAPTGGAFGGKEDYPSLLAGHAAILAYKAKHPVAIFYDREEDVKFTTKRHPSHHRDRAFVKKDGTIIGADLTIHLDGGAYCTLSQVVLARTALTAMGSYHVPHVRIHAKAVATNGVPGGAFRGFGGPQAVFAVEMLIEKIATTLGLPPEQVRRRNLIREGQDTATGQVLRYSVSAVDTFEDVLVRSGYRKKFNQFRKHNAPILERLKAGRHPGSGLAEMLRGIGISAFQHGAGFTGTGENKIGGKITVRIEPDGSVLILSAATEMGQGESTVMRTILAQALQVDRDLIRLAEVNTDLVPDSGPTVASRTTMIIGSLLVDAAKDIIDLLGKDLSKDHKVSFDYKNGVFRAKGQKVSFEEAARHQAGVEIHKEYHHPPFIKFDDIHWRGDAYPVFSWAAAVAEIEVDPVTFETTVKRYTTTHDIGKAINYDQAMAQIQGGSVQGIGYALYEKVRLEDGKYDITGFTDYIIPTTEETPEFDIRIMENPYPYGPFGAKGLGEMPFVGAAPAVISALWMIFGRAFTHIPVTPEDLAALFSK